MRQSRRPDGDGPRAARVRHAGSAQRLADEHHRPDHVAGPGIRCGQGEHRRWDLVADARRHPDGRLGLPLSGCFRQALESTVVLGPHQNCQRRSTHRVIRQCMYRLCTLEDYLVSRFEFCARAARGRELGDQATDAVGTFTGCSECSTTPNSPNSNTRLAARRTLQDDQRRPGEPR
jgi:hypothetical protein